MKHFSGKYDLNTISDHQSRHPSECTSDMCSIRKFIENLAETVLDPTAKCAPIQPNFKEETDPECIHKMYVTDPDDILHDQEEDSACPKLSLGANQVHNTFFNRAAWIQAQDNNNSCRAAKTHLMSGKTPSSKAGDFNNEIRFLIRNAKLAPDGLLVTKGD